MMERITLKLSKIEIAQIQLDRAISLFFNENDYISAITLAGAAEEILGKLLVKENVGKRPALKELIESSIEIHKKFHEEELLEKEIVQVANYYRNNCKHFGSGEDLLFSVDFEAAHLIDRASENYFKLTNSETPGMVRFRESNYFSENWKNS